MYSRVRMLVLADRTSIRVCICFLSCDSTTALSAANQTPHCRRFEVIPPSRGGRGHTDSLLSHWPGFTDNGRQSPFCPSHCPTPLYDDLFFPSQHGRLIFQISCVRVDVASRLACIYAPRSAELLPSPRITRDHVDVPLARY